MSGPCPRCAATTDIVQRDTYVWADLPPLVGRDPAVRVEMIEREYVCLSCALLFTEVHEQEIDEE